jgi:energy-coupling factor transporter ATP-binding protein EcfA2
MAEVASPFATGAGGSSFEHKVQAAFLATMLCKGYFPCLPEGEVENIRLQARQAGYHIDDLVITIKSTQDTIHKLLLQIKHKLIFTERNDIFNEVIEAAWNDYNNSNLFSKSSDKIAIVTELLPSNVINHLRPVLDWARTSISASEFIGKVYSEKFSSKQKQQYVEVFKFIIEKVTNNNVSQDDLWSFLKVINLLQYDFDQKEGTHLSHVLTMIDLSKESKCTKNAVSIWGEIVSFIQDENQVAATIDYNNIPEEIKTCFFSNTFAPSNSVKRLQEHSIQNNKIIHDTVDVNIHIDRTDIYDHIINTIETQQFVLITGVAGIGKSAIIKKVSELISKKYPTFLFKADEFNYDHIHNFFSNMGINENLNELSARFALIEHKFFFIDAIEKLLEMKNQDAFKQFIEFIKEDNTVRIVATCREYSYNNLLHAFFIPSNTPVKLITIPKLNAQEIDFIKYKIPRLTRLFDNYNIKNLLRIPFYLKFACQIEKFITNEVKEISEETFRNIIWEYVIEKRSNNNTMMRLKRKECFIQIALKRAKTMRTFVEVGTCDLSALNELVNDEILIENNNCFALAHDLFEDWAITNYINSTFGSSQIQPEEFFNIIGTEPAMRRSFRMWLFDKIELSDDLQLNNFIINVIKNKQISQFWRDETITSILYSNKSSSFLEAQKLFFLEGDKKLVLRVIHILRTACKGLDEELLISLGFNTNIDILSSIFTKPVGQGWKNVINFIFNNLNKFSIADLKVICGLLKDWSTLVKQGKQKPEESRTVGLITLYFLDIIKENYQCKNEMSILIEILFKVSSELKKEIESLLNTTISSKRKRGRNYLEEELLEKLLDSIFVSEICESMPETVIKATRRSWLAGNTDEDDYYDHMNGLEGNFGVSRNYKHKYFPASGLQGPIHFLLKYHPMMTIDFIIEMVNRMAENYASSRYEKVFYMDFQLDNGEKIRQWWNKRLWLVYNEGMPAPHLLSSTLMALENWLFEMLTNGSTEINAIIEKIFKSSNSVLITSLILNLTIAFPYQLKKLALLFIKVPMLFQLEFIRQMHDKNKIADIRKLLGAPSKDVFEDIYYNEREKSNNRKHKEYNLEKVTLDLQLTELKNEVFNIIDNYKLQLPAIENQTEDDKVWRIKLKRMDLREYDLEENKNNDNSVTLIPKQSEPDLKQLHDDAAEKNRVMNERFTLMNWCMNKFLYKENKQNPYSDWKDIYLSSKKIYEELQNETEDNKSIYSGGSEYAAAIIIRDYVYNSVNISSNEAPILNPKFSISPEEKLWASNLLLNSVTNEMNNFDDHTRVSKLSTHGSRPSAYVLPLLIGLFDDNFDLRTRYCIIGSLTHPSEEVKKYACWGVKRYLWHLDKDFAERCLWGLIEYSKLIELHYAMNDYYDDESKLKLLQTTELLRKQVAGYEQISFLNWTNINKNNYSFSDLIHALEIIPNDCSNNIFFKDLFQNAMTEIIKDEIEQEKPRSYSSNKIDYEIRHRIINSFVAFTLSQELSVALEMYKPVLEKMFECAKLTSDIILEIVTFEDRNRVDNIFWEVWWLFSQKAFSYDKLEQMEFKYIDGVPKIVRSLIFAGLPWQKEIREWDPLKNNKGYLEYVSSTIGHTPIGFGALVETISQIGTGFLPEALLWLSANLSKGNREVILNQINTAFYLESILRNVIYSVGIQLRNNEPLKEAIVILLDALVDNGSSVSFQLRESIITPSPQ